MPVPLTIGISAIGTLPVLPGPLPVASFWSDLYGTRVQYLGHASLADGMSVEGDPGARDFTATFTASGRAVFQTNRPVARSKALRKLSVS